MTTSTGVSNLSKRFYLINAIGLYCQYLPQQVLVRVVWVAMRGTHQATQITVHTVELTHITTYEHGARPTLNKHTKALI